MRDDEKLPRPTRKRSPVWYKQYKGACVKATIVSPKGLIIDYQGSLTDTEFKALLDVLMPAVSKP